MPSTVRRLGLPAICALLSTGLCAAQPPEAAGTAVPPSPPVRTVYLDGPAAVEQLKTDDPTHYGEVKAILAAADVICAAGPGTVQQTAAPGLVAGPQAHAPRCEAMFLQTSNPPKRQISFTLGDTHYVALVVLTRDKPALTPALAIQR
jgi:hypothetical protein